MAGIKNPIVLDEAALKRIRDAEEMVNDLEFELRRIKGSSLETALGYPAKHLKLAEVKANLRDLKLIYG